MLRVVVDTNKVIASLLRDGRARRLLFHPSLELLLPRYVLEEINEHRGYLEEKVSPRAIDFVLSKISRKARVVGVREISPENLHKARRLAGGFDIDDYPFIATAMEYNAIIWTNDKELIRHALASNEYIAVDTPALERLLEGEQLTEVLKGMKERYIGITS
ncbi:MAG: PIN domain-containing protein [Desulfurococcales archaeon]|nr:PIN domain-containing protein [Desulfurococcales archaeon]